MLTQFVAEVSSNHGKDLARCLQFIDVAADIGCDAVKFQLFKIDQLFAPEILTESPGHRARVAWELPTEFIQDIALRCYERQVQFICTPFYLDAVEELLPYVDTYKIASYELLWAPLLQACAQTGKPIVLSTGMANMKEIDRAVSVILDAGCCDLTLLHCTSGYPTPIAECNLKAIDTMRQRWILPTGWSDHSVSPAVVLRAVQRWQASMIEFHLDLDGTGDEYKTGHCWLPEAIAPIIATVRAGEQADGDGVKQPVPSELPDVAWRRDPSDGLRPLLATRKAWRAKPCIP